MPPKGDAARLVSADVVVVGGGNAALCAALAASDVGASVILLERAPREFRGGNTRHTRNIRTAHTEADGYVTGAYPQAEFLADLASVTTPSSDAELARFVVSESETLPEWMVAHGVRWQPPLRGTLGLARTNHFFLGGGKALVNAYYRTAEARGIEIRYGVTVQGLRLDETGCTAVAVDDGTGPGEFGCRAVVIASGGFEANRDWLREHWGARADNFVVRGTPFNDGLVLRDLLSQGALSVGDPRAAHAIAVDARSPDFDGGIVTRIDAIPLGIAVNGRAERFYDEGEEVWPKRYATWGALIADQEDQRATAILDARAFGKFIPGAYPPLTADTVEGLAAKVGLDPAALCRTVDAFNASCQSPCDSDLDRLDGCSTIGLTPPKSHWAVPISEPPFYAYPLRVGITFTYLGLRVNRRAQVVRGGGPVANLFAAGEVMAGNILTRGYLAGFGLTIGTVFGRLAGREAATCSSSR